MDFLSEWALIIGAVVFLGSLEIINQFTASLNKRDEIGPVVYRASESFGLKDREYHFTYKRIDGSWRAYVLKTPDFGMRPNNIFETHTVFDGDKLFISWDKPVDSFEEIQKISRLWADLIQEYIATGKRF